MSSKHGSLDRTDFTVAFLSHVLLEANGDAAMEVGVVLGTNGGPVSYKELMGFRRGFLGCGCMLGGAAVVGLFVPERYDRTNYFSPAPLDLLAPLISATSGGFVAEDRLFAPPWLFGVMFGTTVRLGAWRPCTEPIWPWWGATSLPVATGAPAGSGQSTSGTYLRCPCSPGTRPGGS